MSYEAYTYEELKAEEEIAKNEFFQSAKKLTEKKVLLSEDIGLLKTDQNITAFNSYVCGLVTYKHLPAFADTLRNFFIRKEGINVEILDNYINELKSHFEIHTRYIDIKILLKHKNVKELPQKILLKQYETFFANEEKKLTYKDIVDNYFRRLMEVKNGGKAAIHSFSINLRKKVSKNKTPSNTNEKPSWKKEKSVNQLVTNEDLTYEDFWIPFEFTNGVKGTIAIYQGGIYIKHNGFSPDGKQVNVFTYNGEIGNESIHFSKEDIINSIINNKEKPNE
ncbi:hypothetical protein [Pseudomonas sp. MF6747]|uniref:hypothetical protein n=1 Tax=Pseudomonas sp. MF6747 TaxID=2797527 RepID=UPI00190CEE83|nr:hypothetical protein [Pseudomonas sp. MF6747]MBK3506762.1 hypothetical protein [Pseudomonas sp. MF6747]